MNPSTFKNPFSSGLGRVRKVLIGVINFLFVCHVVYDIYISIHPSFSFLQTLWVFCRVIFLNSQTGRIGAWVVAIGVVVSVCLVYCFAILPSLFTCNIFCR